MPSALLALCMGNPLVTDGSPRKWDSNAKLSLQWRHNGHDGISNHQPHHCLLNHSLRCRPKKTSKLCLTGLCAGNSSVTSEFHAELASNAENVSIWLCHHVDAVFDVSPNKLLNIQLRCQWFKMPWCSCDVTVMLEDLVTGLCVGSDYTSTTAGMGVHS